MKLKVAITILAILFTTASLGRDRVTLEDTISVNAESTIHINVPVGSLEIETYDGDEIFLEVEVKEADNDWFKSVDLEDAEIEVRKNGDRIYLEIDMEDVVQNWEVKIPEDADLDIDLGVGEVDIEDFKRSAI